MTAADHLAGADSYGRLALQRAQGAQARLVGQRTAMQLLDGIARSLEDAAGTLLYAATTLVPATPGLRDMFVQQAGGLLAIAARFEQSADHAAQTTTRSTAQTAQTSERSAGGDS